MTPADVIDRLLDLPPLRLEAIALFIQFQHDPPADETAVIALQLRIEAAVAQLDMHVRKTKGIVERCQRLQPSPSNTLPSGF